MRKIKFKAWDKKNNKMIDNIVGIRFYPGGIVVDYQTEGGFEETECGDVELIQFTGLHDKNGKEIWEGDVVEYGTTSYGGFDTVSVNVMAEIIFAYSRWYTKTIRARPNRMFSNMEGDDFSCSEVIGNIYENPELLKEAKCK